LTLRTTPFVLVAVVMAWLAVPAARADIQISIRDGRVVLVANNATIADIMAEWAKVGQIKIVNADKIPRDVVTLELRNVNERQALDILLRSTSGFLVALRADDDPNASLFDRIVIMPPSVAPPPPAVNASAPQQYPRAPSPAAEMPAPEPAPVQAADNTNDRPDDPPPQLLVGAALAERPAESFTSSNTRHMMETVDPRNFRLPPSMQVGAMGSPTVVVPPGAAAPIVGSGRPGVITMPATPTAP
jgi:hypothetical protein